MPALAWLPWSAASFARARAEGKPVLLSIAPTWSWQSAAMDRDSFGDPAVAAVAQRRYVSIRVDADRRPDICERYCLGGWPTTAFLTPDGDVLGGGTYVERVRLAGVLERVADAFAAGPPANAAALGTGGCDGHGTLSAADLVGRVDASFDAEHGGYGGTPRFPHTAPVHLALALVRDRGSAPHREQAIRTLDAIGWGALHDDRDGGFFRCCAGADWTAPDREKLLEVNALLLRLYVDAFETLALSRYAERAEDVLRYVQSRLADPVEGGWAGSQRADPAYYASASVQPAAPPVDRTLYTGWNATMASAALRAGQVFSDPAISEFAIKSLERVLELCYEPGGGVAHYHDGQPHVRGLLADQIAMAEAQLDAFDATADVVYRMLAEELVLHAIRTLWDEEAGGFLDRVPDPRSDVGFLRQPRKPFAANCAAARLLRRMARTCDRAPLLVLADRTLTAVGPAAAAAGPAAAELALALTAAGE